MKFLLPNCEPKKSIIRQLLSKANSRIRILMPFALRGLIISLLFTQFGVWTHGISSAYADPLQNPMQAQSNGPDSNEDLAKRAQEIARIRAEIDKNWKEYQKRPRRKFIGAGTKEFRFSHYMEAWRVKVESVGNLNYPEEAKSNKTYGSLMLSVSIKSDGSLEDVEVSKSSGQPVLDAAAVRIVKLAAPFAPFTPEIAKDTDVLTISRTWIFTDKYDKWQELIQ